MAWLQRVLGALFALALFVAAFVFASVILAFAAVAALLLWAWLAWRLRKLGRDGARGEGVVIEGEYRVERESRRVEKPRG